MTNTQDATLAVTLTRDTTTVEPKDVQNATTGTKYWYKDVVPDRTDTPPSVTRGKTLIKHITPKRSSLFTTEGYDDLEIGSNSTGLLPSPMGGKSRESGNQLTKSEGSEKLHIESEGSEKSPLSPEVRKNFPLGPEDPDTYPRGRFQTSSERIHKEFRTIV